MRRNKGGRAERLDEAARAGWLYYVAGRTQDEIARQLGVSRQVAQRLVSLSVSEGLVKVRLDHPLAHCLSLASQLREVQGLRFCEVVPTDPASSSSTLGVAEAGAAELERHIESPGSEVIAIGTGRTLKAAIELLAPTDAPGKQIVSLTGNVAPDGSLAFYSAIFSMAARVKARHYLMPSPVFAGCARERDLLHEQWVFQQTLAVARRAEVVFVGVGNLGEQAPLHVDGFISQADLQALRAAGAVGEIIGWAFDERGTLLAGETNLRVVSAPLYWPPSTLVVALAKGRRKLPALRAAVRGGLVNGLITDEWTATALLESP